VNRPTTFAALWLVVAGLPLGGCLFPTVLFENREEEEDWHVPPQPPPQNPTPTQPPARAPSVDSIEIADWPPMGPNGSVLVKVTDPDANLQALSFQFKHTLLRSLSGGFAAVSVTGAELGEGYGKLSVTATDTTSAYATRNVDNLLVDLTPPKITLGKTVVAADGELELWVGDAWILGKVELSFAGKSLTHTFDPGYPGTLGTTWDYSLVKFPMAALPHGPGQAAIVATDAAGNSAVESFELLIDGEPPSVAITAPAEGASLSGVISVQLSASDPGGGPVWLELSLGGTPIGTATGPTATLKLDTSELVPGPATLVATASDQAGNLATITRAIVIE
jgi:hypothetical protein